MDARRVRRWLALVVALFEAVYHTRGLVESERVMTNLKTVVSTESLEERSEKERCERVWKQVVATFWSASRTKWRKLQGAPVATLSREASRNLELTGERGPTAGPSPAARTARRRLNRAHSATQLLQTLRLPRLQSGDRSGRRGSRATERPLRRRYGGRFQNSSREPLELLAHRRLLRRLSVSPFTIEY